MTSYCQLTTLWFFISKVSSKLGAQQKSGPVPTASVFLSRWKTWSKAGRNKTVDRSGDGKRPRPQRSRRRSFGGDMVSICWGGQIEVNICRSFKAHKFQLNGLKLQHKIHKFRFFQIKIKELRISSSFFWWFWFQTGFWNLWAWPTRILNSNCFKPKAIHEWRIRSTSCVWTSQISSWN